jgi:hypothetical protein
MYVYRVCFLGCYGLQTDRGKQLAIDTSVNVISGENAQDAVDAAERKWQIKDSHCSDDAPINTDRHIKLISVERICGAEIFDGDAFGELRLIVA